MLFPRMFGRLWLPNRKNLTPLYYPTWPQIPAQGLVRIIGYQFLNVDPLATAYASVQVMPAFLARSLVGWNLLSQGGTDFGLQIYHNTDSGQRQLFSTSLVGSIAVGTAQNPVNLQEPELFNNNDSIRFQVKNLSATTADSIWVGLWGADVQIS